MRFLLRPRPRPAHDEEQRTNTMEHQCVGAGNNSKRNVDVSFQHLCAVVGCSSQRRYVDVSFHVFPKNVAVREKWIEFLGHGNVKKHSWVCSQHFTQDCFYNWQEKKMGFASKLILKPDAVPSIRTQSSGQPVSEPVRLCGCCGSQHNIAR